MRKAIEEKNEVNNKSRLVAGYCYEWTTKKKENNKKYGACEKDMKKHVRKPRKNEKEV